MTKRVLVIGLDSAPWDLTTKWVREGRLPTIGGLMAEGASGVLRSTFPALSPAAWSSFATGMSPGKHGVYDHVHRLPSSYRYVPTNSQMRGGKTLWRIISEHGGSVGVINVPETYPPEPVNGFLIAGMDTPGNAAQFCYPPDLLDELEEALGDYTVFASTSDEDLEKTRTALHETARMRIEVGRYLWRRYQPQFMILVLTATDTVQHYFWEFMDPHHPHHEPAQAERYGNVIQSLYRDIDRQLADLLALVDEDTVVVLMSDHGAGPLHRKLYTNNWLREEGWLQLKRGLLGRLKLALFRLGFTADNALRFAAELKLGITDQISPPGPAGETTHTGLASLFLSLADVDWTNTHAYALGTNIGGIYLNVKGREPQGIVQPGAAYEALREEIAQRLREWDDEVTGEPLISEVYMREELYSGPYLERAPDILFDCFDGRYLPFVSRGFPTHTLTGPPRVISGSHRRNGLVVLTGTPFQRGISLPAHNIEDVSPTILHILGYAVPEDMDGRVMTEACTQHFLSAHPLRKGASSWVPAESSGGYTPAEEAAVLEALRDLGYV